MKRYYKFPITAFFCLYFVLSMFMRGQAENVSNVSISPNPFNPYPTDNQSTTISYTLTNSALLWLRIYDLGDTLKRKLVTPSDRINPNRTNPPGNYSEIWNGKDDLGTLVPEATYPFCIDDIAWISTSSDISSGAQYPYDVAVNPSNSLIIWVADSAGRLLNSANGGSSWAQVSYGGSGVAYGIAISSNGQKIYVLESANRRLYYSTDGGGTWNNYSLWGPMSAVPRDITCSGDGTVLYAVDSNTNRVYKSTDSGANWNSGVQPTGATVLTGVAVDPNNSNIILVADRGANKIYKSTNGGVDFTPILSSSGTGDGQLSGPYQVSIDTNGHYWVSERGNYRVQQFDSGNNWVMTVGGIGAGAGNYQFNTNSVSLGVFVASFSGQQSLYVADYYNKKIKRFAYDNYTSDIIVSSDKIPPAAITNLATTGTVGSYSAQLTWTAPGDDGSTGQASSYDVRYSKSPITTDAAFSSATQATGEPAPSPTGITEYFAVTGMESNTTYYFAVKTRDEALNTSGLSTPSPSGKTGLLYGYNMVSCPLQPSPNTSSAVFGDDAGLNWMYYWHSTWTGAGDPDSAGYYGDEYGRPNPPYRAKTIVPGRGIYLLSFKTDNPTDASGTEITDASYVLSLDAGWNLIGNPYGTAVNLSSCYVTYTSTITYANAVASVWIGNALYIWNGSAYDSILWNVAQLEPWKGYWIFSYYDLDLIIYKP
ncbi:MAG: YCF48-related protein [Thermodesulfovibrionales bacterium]|nr:YCF48-related protein [Thermodesulfovibrionales bacterium]